MRLQSRRDFPLAVGTPVGGPTTLISATPSSLARGDAQRAVSRGGGSVLTPSDPIVAQTCVGLRGVEDGACVAPMTCMFDRREHAVTESQFVLGVRGLYLAVCVHVVVPGSLSAPPGCPCPACVALLAPISVTERAGTHVIVRLRRAARRLLGHAAAEAAATERARRGVRSEPPTGGRCPTNPAASRPSPPVSVGSAPIRTPGAA